MRYSNAEKERDRKTERERGSLTIDMTLDSTIRCPLATAYRNHTLARLIKISITLKDTQDKAERKQT